MMGVSFELKIGTENESRVHLQDSATNRREEEKKRRFFFFEPSMKCG